MRNPEVTRNLIISKSTSIFNKKGYRATSLSDITKATGMTKGAIYGNFDNKDAVAVASFEYATDTILGGLRKEIKSAPTAPMKLKSILTYYNSYIKNPPIEGGCPVINTSVEADDEHPLLRLKVVGTIAMIKDSLKQILHRGILEGQLQKELDVEQFANTFYASIKGAILISRVEGNTRTYDSVRQSLTSQIDSISL